MRLFGNLLLEKEGNCMSQYIIPDAEALYYITTEKEIIQKSIIFPKQNEFSMLDAITKGNPNEKYIIDINRKRAILSRCTFQQRVYTSIPLIRLDIDTKPHRNPDGQKIPGNHIHIYKEGYNLAWAYPLDHKIINEINPNFDINLFQKLFSHAQNFTNFCHFLNITKIPIFQISMFT